MKKIKKKDIHAGFSVTTQTAKVIPIVHDNCLVRMEKAINFVGERREQKMGSH